MQTSELDARLDQYLATYPGIRLNRIQRLKNGEVISYFGDLTSEQRNYLTNRALQLDQPEAVASVVQPLNTQELDAKLFDYLNIFPKIRQQRIERILAGEDIRNFGSLNTEQKEYLKSKLASAPAQKRKSPSPDPTGKRLRFGRPTPPPAPSGKQSRVYLFDAHAYHKREVQAACSQIRWFLPVTPPDEQLSFDKMIDQSFSNPYFRFLQSQFTSNELKALYEPRKGLSLDNDFWSARIAELQQRQNPTVMLGWNGTITKFEDLPLMPKPDNVAAELEFLVGGPSRLNALRLLIARLQDDGIRVVIVTDVESCGSPHFVSLLIQFSLNLEWICTGKQDKGKALKQRSEFADVCEPQERIRHAIFFDNSEEALDDVRFYCKQIQFVKIPDSGSIGNVSVDNPAFKTMLDGIGKNNLYYRASILSEGDRFDVKSGLRPKHAEILQKWLADTENVAQEGRAVLLDWDRTLTVVEGFRNLMGSTAFQDLVARGRIQESRVIEDALKYLTGGVRRLNWLRALIDSIPVDVELVVVTNNKSCLNAENKKFFKSMISSLFNGRSYSLVCGADFEFDKGAALAASTMFRDICIKPSDDSPSHSQAELDLIVEEFYPAILRNESLDYFQTKMKDYSQSDTDYIINQLETRIKKAQQVVLQFQSGQSPSTTLEKEVMQQIAQQESNLLLSEEATPVVGAIEEVMPQIAQQEPNLLLSEEAAPVVVAIESTKASEEAAPVVVAIEPTKAKKRKTTSRSRSPPTRSTSRSPTVGPTRPTVGPTYW